MTLEREDMVLRSGVLSRMARGRSRVENSVAAGVGECGCELSLSCRFREIWCSNSNLILVPEF